MEDRIPSQPDGRRQRRSIQVLALGLGLGPLYLFAVWSHLARGADYTLPEMLLYPLLLGGGGILLIALLLRLLCGEPLRALNLKAAAWWRDLLHGVVLAILFVALALIEQFTLMRWLPGEPPPMMRTLLEGLSRDPLLLALWLGPVLWIGIAGFEEVSRVFLLTRLWNIGRSPAARWSAVAASAALFGLVHFPQGAAGMISTGLMGLVAAAYYMARGRLWPLVISHALFDAAGIVAAIALYRGGML